MTLLGKLCRIVFCSLLVLQRTAAQNSSFQPGDVILGGLFLLHYSTDSGECGSFYPSGLGHVQAMIFAIDKINNDPKLLPSITLGYDIRDYCQSAGKAMKETYRFVRGNELAGTSAKSSSSCSVKGNKTDDAAEPIAAIIGPSDSGSAVLVGSLLQVAGIPAISTSATSNELSSQQYRQVFRTASPDGRQAIAMADIIQYFNWSYVAAVAMDDSYGRNGVWALETEAEKRETFCVSFAEYNPRQEYSAKLKRVVSKLKLFPNVIVVVLWLFGGYGRQFLKEAAQQKLHDRTWILSDSLASKERLFTDLESYKTMLHGSLGIQPRYLDNWEFENFLVGLNSKSTTETGVPWWREFWEVEGGWINCTLKDKTFCNGTTSTMTPLEKTLRKIYDTYIPYVIDAVYAVANALHRLQNCSESMDISPKSKGCSEIHRSVIPKELEAYLRTVDFQGLTGRVMFDRFGDPVTSSYDIVHFQWGDTKSKFPQKLVIGSWEKNRESQLRINASKIKWNTESCRKQRHSEIFLPGWVPSRYNPVTHDSVLLGMH